MLGLVPGFEQISVPVVDVATEPQECVLKVKLTQVVQIHVTHRVGVQIVKVFCPPEAPDG